MTASWRDIAEQLTADQIAGLELLEQQGSSPDYLLAEARVYSEINLRGAFDFGHVPRPEGAETCHEWGKNKDGRPMREFNGVIRRIAKFSVFALGEQFEDGTVENKRVIVQPEGSGERELTTADARELASLLRLTADEVDRDPGSPNV